MSIYPILAKQQIHFNSEYLQIIFSLAIFSFLSADSDFILVDQDVLAISLEFSIEVRF